VFVSGLQWGLVCVSLSRWILNILLLQVAADLDQASRIAYGGDRRWGRVVTLQVSGQLLERLASWPQQRHTPVVC